VKLRQDAKPYQKKSKIKDAIANLKSQTEQRRKGKPQKARNNKREITISACNLTECEEMNVENTNKLCKEKRKSARDMTKGKPNVRLAATLRKESKSKLHGVVKRPPYQKQARLCRKGTRDASTSKTYTHPISRSTAKHAS
jgi:hypothetical protein